MLISIVDVARAEEVASCVLLEKLRYTVFDSCTEATAHAEHREGDAVLSELASLADDRALGVLHVGLSTEHFIVELAHEGKDRRLPQRDAIEQPFRDDRQVSLSILLHLYLLGIEAEASYKVNVCRGEVGEFAREEACFVLRQGELRHLF